MYVTALNNGKNVTKNSHRFGDVSFSDGLTFEYEYWPDTDNVYLGWSIKVPYRWREFTSYQHQRCLRDYLRDVFKERF